MNLPAQRSRHRRYQGVDKLPARSSSVAQDDLARPSLPCFLAAVIATPTFALHPHLLRVRQTDPPKMCAASRMLGHGGDELYHRSASRREWQRLPSIRPSIARADSKTFTASLCRI